MKWIFIAAAALVGCGSSGGSPDAATDAPSDGASDAATGCNLAAPFGPMVAIAELNTSAAEDTPRLTHDERTIYFSRETTSGAADIFVATRASATGAFGAAVPLALNGPASDDSPSPSGDALTLYFASSRTSPFFDIFSATRPSTSVDFDAPSPVAALNSASGNTFGPYILPDGNMYYASDVSSVGGTGYSDLHRAIAGAPDTSSVFANVNTQNTETDPIATLDELTVYYLSDEDGWHVRRATRASTSDPFDIGAPVYELDSDLTTPGFISDDGCRIYVSKEIASGDTDLYVATKP
jgi:hypothetical protein